MNWLYKLLGFKKKQIYEADDDCIILINTKGYKAGDYIWIK